IARQGSRRKAAALAPLSAPPQRLLDLPRLSEALRTHLRSVDCRPSFPSSGRRQTPQPKPISTRPALSARRRRPRRAHSRRRSQSRMNAASKRKQNTRRKPDNGLRFSPDGAVEKWPCGAVPRRQGVATGQHSPGSRYARLQWRSVFGTTPGEQVMSDGLSKLYHELLSGSYDCVDRIVLNAYFGMGHSPGGFRVWWRALTG